MRDAITGHGLFAPEASKNLGRNKETGEVSITHGGSYNNSFTFILKDGILYASGANYEGQLGFSRDVDEPVSEFVKTGPENKMIAQLRVGGCNSYIICEEGRLWVTGSNDSGQLGLGDKRNRYGWEQSGPLNKSIKQIQVDGIRSYILCEDDSLWVCGGNFNGQLGHVDKQSINAWTQTGPDNETIKQFINVGLYTFILCESGELYRAGYKELDSDTLDWIKIDMAHIASSGISRIVAGLNEIFIFDQDDGVYRGCLDFVKVERDIQQVVLADAETYFLTKTDLFKDLEEGVKRVAYAGASAIKKFIVFEDITVILYKKGTLDVADNEKGYSSTLELFCDGASIERIQEVCFGLQWQLLLLSEKGELWVTPLYFNKSDKPADCGKPLTAECVKAGPPGKTIKRVFGSFANVSVICEDGSLWCCGNWEAQREKFNPPIETLQNGWKKIELDSPANDESFMKRM